MNQSKSNILKDFLEYVLIYLLIGFSVMPFFATNELWLAGLTFFLFLYVLLTNQLYLSKIYLGFLILLILVLVMQSITMEHIDIRSNTGTMIRFLFPYFALLIMREQFLKKYIKVVYFLTIIGLIFWLLKNLVPGFNQQLVDFAYGLPFDEESRQHFLIYSSRSKEHFGFVLSNSGFTYEPGAYSIILGIALILNIILAGRLYTKKSLVFIFALITTFSTVGYISLFIILLGYAFERFVSKRFFSYFAISFLALIAYLVFTRADFMGAKITSQIEIAEDTYATRGRFASAMADLSTWRENPVWGTGKSEETYLKASHSLGFTEEHRVNGLANFLAKFGLIFWFAYLYLLFLSFKKLLAAFNRKSKQMAFYLVALLCLAFAQICMQWSVFIALLYLPLILRYSQNNNEKKNISNIPQ